MDNECEIHVIGINTIQRYRHIPGRDKEYITTIPRLPLTDKSKPSKRLYDLRVFATKEGRSTLVKLLLNKGLAINKE